MNDMAMNGSLTVNEKAYRILRLLGKGKGGYSYLAESEGDLVVIKQIHHEPCDYYSFGDKIEYSLKNKIVDGKLLVDQGIIAGCAGGGFENICEDDNGITKPYVLHAEANAITKLARSSNNSDGATIYITASPCIECAKLIIQAGIKRVVYGEKYRLTDGIELLERAGIEVIYLGE